ncbi:MAG: hypothetical protein GKR94_13780 [Gammaproteobacteria bacterium]|nr:hypothetical protein [Gammaproteobacteria bacterium]
MLQNIRDRAKGWLAWVIVIVICVPFALWGIQEYFGVDPNVPVIDVNGQEISLQTFNLAYQRAQMQRPVDIDDPDAETQRKNELVEQLINNEVIVQGASAQGLRISDAQLIGALQSTPTFQRDGRFSQEQYEASLRNVGYTSSNFEFYQRRSMLVNQIASALGDSSFSADFETEQLLGLQAQRRTFSALIIKSAAQENVEPTEQELKDYYESNKQEFNSEEQVKLAYVVLSKAKLAESIAIPGDDVLRAQFETDSRLYTPPEQRTVRHILVEVDEEADAAAVDAAKSEIEVVRARIAGGEAFEDVAKEVSADAASAAQGGSLGEIGRGFMVPEFEEAAFALAAGELSEPIRSPFGFHLIRVDEISGDGEPTFAEVRDEVLAEYRKKRAEGEYYEQGTRLRDMAFTESGSLDFAAEELALTVEQTPFISREGITGHPVAGDQRVLRAAFGQEVLEQRVNSDVLDHIDGTAIVVRVEEHRPSAEQSFEDVRNEVEKVVRAQKGQAAAKKAGEALVRELRGGLDAEAAANRMELKWTEFAALARGAKGPDAEALELAFKMPHPKEEQPEEDNPKENNPEENKTAKKNNAVFDGVINEAKDYVVVMLTEVSEAKLPLEAAKTQFANGLARDIGQFELRGLIDALRAKADVEIFESRL